MNPTLPHYALLAYAQEMHQYTLELWMELTRKTEPPALPLRPSSSNQTVNPESLARGRVVSEDPVAQPPQTHS